MGTELQTLQNIARRWWWLIAILPVLGVIAGSELASRQKPLYASTAQMMINPTTGTASIDYGTIQGVQNLATTYQQLIVTWPILEPAITDLGYPGTVEDFSKKIATAAIPDTMLIHVTATDPSPEQAALIANTVVERFRDYIALQSVSVKVNIVLAVPAQVPTTPFAPRTPLYLALGGLLGLLSACGIAGLFEFRDDSVHGALEAMTATGFPVIGIVPFDRRLRRADAGYLPFMMRPREPFAESIRFLRSRVLHTGEPHQRLCLTVSSPSHNEGKSTVVCNLAAAFAQAGLSVAVVDGNLRNPKLHSSFHVGNDRGLSTLVTHPDMSWKYGAVVVADPNMVLVPSGPSVNEAIDLLDGFAFRQIISKVRASFDIVLIDSPPLDTCSDALAFAASSDGTLMVCRSGRTGRSDLVAACNAIADAGGRLVGVVLNRERGNGLDGAFSAQLARHTAGWQAIQYSGEPTDVRSSLGAGRAEGLP